MPPPPYSESGPTAADQDVVLGVADERIRVSGAAQVLDIGSDDVARGVAARCRAAEVTATPTALLE